MRREPRRLSSRAVGWIDAVSVLPVVDVRPDVSAAAVGDRLLFIDCDFVLLPGAVRAHAEAARPGRFVAAMCKYLPEQPSRLCLQTGLSADEAVRAYDDLPQRPIQRAHEKFLWYTALIRLKLAPKRKLRCSSHFSIGRSDFEAINGYDEQFHGWGGEDEDMAHRMMLARMRPCSIIPRARTLHVWHQPELGGRHWREGSNVEYLNRSVVPARCELGYARPHTSR